MKKIERDRRLITRAVAEDGTSRYLTMADDAVVFFPSSLIAVVAHFLGLISLCFSLLDAISSPGRLSFIPRAVSYTTSALIFQTTVSSRRSLHLSVSSSFGVRRREGASGTIFFFAIPSNTNREALSNTVWFNMVLYI